MKNIYLFIGMSGVGKSTIVDELERQHDLKVVQSYTTRPKRYSGETGHIFVSKNEFTPEILPDCVGFTIYNGNYYWALKSQVDECDLYVVDPAGLNVLRAKYDGDKQLKVINVTADKAMRKRRMRERGNSPGEIEQRLAFDEFCFTAVDYDFQVDNSIQSMDGLQGCVDEVWGYICEEEGMMDEEKI